MKKALLAIVPAAVALAAWAAVASAQAQSYPSRPVKVIVPFAPGGVVDVIARMWAVRMSQNLGQQFYIENHGGAGGNLGMGIASRQPPDGYTVLAAASSFAVNLALYKKSSYEAKDFTAVTLLAATPNVLVVHPSVPANTLQEFIALVRSSPGKFSYAMPGAGTPSHLQAELFKRALNLDLVTVPFPGGGPAIQSTLGGHTPVSFGALTSVQPLVAGGKLRALAVTGTKRSPVLPDVPTLAEAGVPGQEADTFTGLLAPAGTPKDIVDKLHAESIKVLANPDMQQQLQRLGFASVGTSPEEFAARLKTEIASWAKLIQDAKIERP